MEEIKLRQIDKSIFAFVVNFIIISKLINIHLERGILNPTVELLQTRFLASFFYFLCMVTIHRSILV